MDEPPRRSPRVRAALGGVVVLALLGLGAAVLGAALTPGSEIIEIDGGLAGSDGSAPDGGTRAGGDAMVDGATADPFDGADSREVVVLHVHGAVVDPGIVELGAGSRVVDALASAGGPTDDADLGGVNLARLVVDGEQLYVPRVGEVPPHAVAGSGTDSRGLVNINLADAAALQTLPGVGPALAARIIAWRDHNGPFRSVDELTAVSGIGSKTLDGFRAQVTV